MGVGASRGAAGCRAAAAAFSRSCAAPIQMLQRAASADIEVAAAWRHALRAGSVTGPPPAAPRRAARGCAGAESASSLRPAARRRRNAALPACTTPRALVRERRDDAGFRCGICARRALAERLTPATPRALQKLGAWCGLPSIPAAAHAQHVRAPRPDAAADRDDPATTGSAGRSDSVLSTSVSQ